MEVRSVLKAVALIATCGAVLTADASRTAARRSGAAPFAAGPDQAGQRECTFLAQGRGA